MKLDLSKIDFTNDSIMELLNHSTEYFLGLLELGVKQGLDLIPIAKALAIDVLDAMFAPKQILRQIAIIAAIKFVLIGFDGGKNLMNHLLYYLTAKGREDKKLAEQLANAKSYAEWKEVAHKLDVLHKVDAWRDSEESNLYDSRVVKKRIKQTSEMLDRGDVFDLMFRFRGGLARDQFGMQHEGLFSKALSGTKVLVERYHETMAKALNFICDSPISDEEIPTDAKLAFFNETRHAYGRTALLLSGGAFLGYYHGGVVKALFEGGYLPRVISGASAGSILASVVGTRNDEELADWIRRTQDVPTIVEINRLDLFRYSTELKSEMARRLNYLVPPGLRWITQPIFSSIFDKKIMNYDTDHFKKALVQNIGNWTFQEAFDRTGRIINITVAPMNQYDPPRLLNYLTAPHVCVWSAAAASCALPGVFDSISLVVKEPNGRYREEHEWGRQEHEEGAKHGYSDGSIESDLPMEQLSELFNVNHFIVSQVNPHTAILSSMSTKATVWSNALYGALVGYMRFLSSQVRDWLKNIVNFIIFRSNAPVWSNRRGLIQALTQDYEGRDNDITILPWYNHLSPLYAILSVIKNPTPQEFADVTRAAEKGTWPHIARIRAHCLVEMTLDKCVQRLRKRITDESVAAAEAVVKVVEGAQKGRRIKMDRTPSFYTSRSIVNLSGLSVADPLPVRRASVNQATPPHNSNLVGSLSKGKNENISIRQRTVSGEEFVVQDIPSYSRNNSTNEFNLIHDDEDFYNVEVLAADVPLQRTNSRRLSSTDGEDAPSFSRNNSEDNLKDPIHKTTNMANFYYKKGHQQ